MTKIQDTKLCVSLIDGTLNVKQIKSMDTHDPSVTFNTWYYSIKILFCPLFDNLVICLWYKLCKWGKKPVSLKEAWSGKLSIAVHEGMRELSRACFINPSSLPRFCDRVNSERADNVMG